MGGEPVPNEMADEREQDCVVARAACLAGSSKTMMVTVRAPSSEGPSCDSGAVAANAAEVKVGALESLELLCVQKGN